MASQSTERSAYEPTSRPALQFSLTALFILTTVFALTLSTFFAISRFLGISAVELLQTSLSQLIYTVPRVIVWSVGLTMAVRRLRSHRRPAMLTAIALTGFIVAILLLQVIQIAVIAGMSSGRFAAMSISWLFTAIGLVYTLVDVACWILILMAIFADRPVARSPFGSRPEIVDPFSQEEPMTGTGSDEEDPFG